VSPVLVMEPEEIIANPREWLDLRRGGITASEIASVLSIAPGEHGSPVKLYWDKILGQEDIDSDAMAYGRLVEPYVADRFAAAHPELDILPGGLHESSARPWQLATFDRLAVTEAGELQPVQCKSAGSWEDWGDAGSDDIPVYYRAQALWEMDVAGADTAWVPCIGLDRKIRIYRLDRDAEAEADIAVMVEAAEAFLRRVAEERPPPVDWTPATRRALNRVHAGLEDRTVTLSWTAARRYRRSVIALREAERRAGLQANRVRAAMGTARWAADPAGERVASRSLSPARRVNLGTLRDAYPNVVLEHTETGEPVDRLTATKRNLMLPSRSIR
jgi:putative phage-type endonuclease